MKRKRLNMNKALLIFIFLLSVNIVGVCSFADTDTVIANGGFNVPNIWSLEFYTDQNVLYTTNVPFTRMDPTDSWVESDGREASSGKSDIGLLCRTNLATPWYMKIQGSAGQLITLGKLKYGLWQPWNRTLGQPSDGTIAGGAGWHDMPTASTAVYTAGSYDENNLPLGTLCMFSFAIDPGRLDPTEIYNSIIQFTLTTVP